MTLKVGLVGSGLMGRTHAAAWKKTPAELTAICSLDMNSRNTLAEQHGAHTVDSLAALIDQSDVVDICTPTYLHYEMVMQVIAAGKHVICEKPLALTAAHAREVVAAARSADVHLLVAHVVRFFPEYAAAKKVVERGEIGRVAITRLTRVSGMPSWSAGGDAWFQDPARSGGMMMDLMIHDFDYARWIAGDVKQVYARSITRQHPHIHADYALTILTHHNGAISHVEGGWAYPRPMFRTALEIAGDHGLIEHPAESSTPLGVFMHQPAGNASPMDVALPKSPVLEDPYTTEIKHFYRVLTGEEAVSRVQPEDGMEAVRIALAAARSAELGRAVLLDEIN